MAGLSSWSRRQLHDPQKAKSLILGIRPRNLSISAFDQSEHAQSERQSLDRAKLDPWFSMAGRIWSIREAFCQFGQTGGSFVGLLYPAH